MKVEQASVNASTAEDSDAIIANAIKPSAKRKHKKNPKYLNSASEVDGDEDSTDENGNQGSTGNFNDLDEEDKIPLIKMRNYFDNQARKHEKQFDIFMSSEIYEGVPNPWRKKSRLTSSPPNLYEERDTQPSSISDESQDVGQWENYNDNQEELTEMQNFNVENLNLNSRCLMVDRAVQTDPLSNITTPAGDYVTEKVFTKCMESLLRKMSRIELMVQNSGSSKEAEKDQQESLLPDFPIKSLQGIDELNDTLKNLEQARKQFKAFIRSVGGKSLGDAMRNSLKQVIDDPLLHSCFTWTGNTKEPTTTKKRALQKEYFLDKIIEAVVSLKPSEYKMTDCQIVAKSWVQHCKDRLKEKD